MSHDERLLPDHEFDVVVVGSLNLDLVARTPRLPRPGETVIGSSFAQLPGGKGLNQAVAAARAGSSVALVGAIGDDDAGDFLRRVVHEEGIDDRWLSVVHSMPTGRALISVDDHGENVIVVVPGANAWVGDDDTTTATLPSGRVTLAQLEVPPARVARAFARAHTTGGRTVLNPAPAAALSADLVGACDLLVPNEHEVEVLGGVEQLQRLGLDTIVVTEGSRGATVFTADGNRRHPAFAVDPIDTTGAGDAFCGALCSRLALGSTLDDALRFATAAGALATTANGAVPSLPHRADIERLLARG